MKSKLIPLLAVVAAVAFTAVPVHAAAESPALTNLLEELTAWATVTNALPPTRPGSPFVHPQQSSADFARASVRRALPSLWLAAGLPDRAERLAGSDPVEFKRAGDQAALATALFAVRRDADALRFLEAASTEPLNLRAPTLLEAAIARLKSGDGPGAVRLMEKAILWRDTNQVFQPVILLHWFARAQIEAQRTNEALSSLDRAVQWARTNGPLAEDSSVSFALRDITEEQARLGRMEQAMTTAALIPETEQRLTARLFVVRGYAEARDADGAVTAVRASLKVDAPNFARMPLAIYAPAEAALALAEAGRWDAAEAFLEECEAAIRSQPMDSTQEGEFQRSVTAARGLLVSRLLMKERGYDSLGHVDPMRLELIAKLAEKLGSEDGRRVVAEARENNRVLDDVRSGRVPEAATVDVSTPEAVRRATRLATILFEEGRGADAERIVARLKPLESQSIHEAAVRTAIARTNLGQAQSLIPKMSSTNAPQEGGSDAQIHLSFVLARLLAAAGRTNEAIAVLTPAVNLARAASKTPSNRWVLATQGIVLQADLGLFKEALNALNPGPGTIATGGGPQIGRRMVRRLGAEAAVEQVRKLGIREVSNLVLLGIAQEMARPGVGDSEWSF